MSAYSKVQNKTRQETNTMLHHLDSELLIDGDGEEGAALDGAVVGNDHHVGAVDRAHPAHGPPAGHLCSTLKTCNGVI